MTQDLTSATGAWLPVSRESLEGFLELAPTAALVAGPDGTIRAVNGLLGRLLGHPPEALVGESLDRLLPEHVRARHPGLVRGFLASPVRRNMVEGPLVGIVVHDGSEVPVEIGLVPVMLPEPDGCAVLVSITDIRRRVHAETSLQELDERYHAIFDLCRDGIGVLQDARFVLANRAMVALNGRSTEELHARPFIDFVHPDFRAIVMARYSGRVVGEASDPPSQYEFRLLASDGRPGPWVEVNAQRIEYNGRPASLILMRDTTLRKEEELLLQDLASRDALTGLLNRRAILARIRESLAEAVRDGGRFALVYLDLDRFKAVNDTLGHAAGDAVLKVTAERIRQALRTQDIIGRIGGDEFVLLLQAGPPGISLEALLARLRESIARPIAVGECAVQVGASLGIACFPEHGSTPEALLQKADDGLYAAKRTRCPSGGP